MCAGAYDVHVSTHECMSATGPCSVTDAHLAVISSFLMMLWFLSAFALPLPSSGSTRKQIHSPGLGLGAGSPTRYPEHLALLPLSTAGARSLSVGWHLEQFVHLLTTNCSHHSAQGHGLAPPAGFCAPG